MKKVKPGPGQESVWDYPRPPRVEPCSKHIRVVVGGEVIADSSKSQRVLETSHPPVYYLPPEDIRLEFLQPANGRSFCEWKGSATYFDLQIGDRLIKQVGWTYLSPTDRFKVVERHVAFYASKVDECFVGDERVAAQQGDFYGGWITSEIVGPFKGAPGTMGW